MVCLVQIIGKAKVPIIKFQEIVSGLAFDVSFNAANGPQAAEYVRDLMQQLPPMRSLILVLKVFLHQRELNEVGTQSVQGEIPSFPKVAWRLQLQNQDQLQEEHGGVDTFHPK